MQLPLEYLQSDVHLYLCFPIESHPDPNMLEKNITYVDTYEVLNKNKMWTIHFFSFASPFRIFSHSHSVLLYLSSILLGTWKNNGVKTLFWSPWVHSAVKFSSMITMMRIKWQDIVKDTRYSHGAKPYREILLCWLCHLLATGLSPVPHSPSPSL